MSPKTPTQNELRLAKILGPIYELKIGPAVSVIVVSGAALVTEANDESRFEKFVAPPHLRMRDIAGDGLFTAFNSEPMWAIAHEVLQPGFTKTAMQYYHKAMTESVEALFEHWETANDQEGFRDIGSDLNALTFEVIGRAGFSQSFGAFDPKNRQFIERLNRAMYWMSTSVNAFPLVRGLLKLRHGRTYERDVNWLNEYAASIVRQRSQGTERPDVSTESPHKDLLDLMLDATTADGRSLTSENIANQVNTFLLAGNETTAGAMAFAMHYVSTHPGVADRVRGEVQDIVGRDGPIQFEHVAKLRFTRKVVDETLRLWPPAPAYFRRARRDEVIGGKYRIPKGTPVMVLALGLHRTEEWGSDADEFDPDRFDRLTTRGSGHPYRPFGTGPRACIGRQFALHEMVLALAMILRDYSVTPRPGYELEVSEQLTLKPKNLRLSMTRRTGAM